MFQKINEREWKGESAHYTLSVKRNGHCGYWMVLTNRTTGVASAPRFGKHFKALASWVAKFEASAAANAPIEYSKCSKSQAELEADCPDFHNLPCAWMDSIEATQDVWEMAA